MGSIQSASRRYSKLIFLRQQREENSVKNNLTIEPLNLKWRPSKTVPSQSERLASTSENIATLTSSPSMGVQHNFVDAVCKTFIHEERGDPQDHCIITVFKSLSNANTLAPDHAEDIDRLTKTSRWAESHRYKIEKVEGGEKMSIRSLRCIGDA